MSIACQSTPPLLRRRELVSRRNRPPYPDHDSLSNHTLQEAANMASFFNKLKSGGNSTTTATTKDAPSKKAGKEEPAPELTPLEKMLQNAGPLREDGTDKFFGLENFGNTCYCNSIVQALFYSESFRDHVVKYPPLSPTDTPNGTRPKVNVTIRPPVAKEPPNTPGAKQKGLSASESMKRRQAITAGMPPPAAPGTRPEDKPDSPEYKKKQAMIKGPILELAKENDSPYGMEECTFTGLKDIFQALIESNTRTGVLSPQRFLEIFKRDNEMFRNSMHQDAHEFYGLVLNDVISNVETNARRIQEREAENKDGLVQSVENALGATSLINRPVNGVGSPGTGWVHDIFEGVLTSETKCLTCETASQRDETFLDLSIDLEEHSSVTSCLRKFSAEEMLCERNKFHCDHCGGLQEAEKRMKIKRLPKVLALHLKRFKYTEDYSRLQKLFHRVVYPYHLRMFNTTDDAEDPDRMYELYAVVVHIGGNAYHGHYVSVIKTKDRGWVLFDDEMVEPVDKHFVRNFFGDKPGMACAYVLFYQETTFEKVQAEMEAEGAEEVKIANETANVAQDNGQTNGHTNGQTNGSTPLAKQFTQPVSPVEERDPMPGLAHARTAPVTADNPENMPATPAPPYSAAPPVPSSLARSNTAAKTEKSKDEKKREKKEQEAAEKARKQAEKDKAKEDERQRRENMAKRRAAYQKQEDDLRKAIEASKESAKEEDSKKKEPSGTTSFLNRSSRASKSMSRKSFAFLSKDKDKGDSHKPLENGHAGNGTEGSASQSDKPKELRERFSFNLGRKKSGNLLSRDGA
ncbi:ubiquitin carboxyl-terminal hydrolase [Colletotrichum karsti]|uniref:Ubiquitin carboxyl-terminal hydrolase n=1 Tax=Colletotrichum karsti TaxID=1095194 RepID=A0A9P6IAC8_9PEZI|nr:ubiquitin carboxyl-terminal hydrolase [Colletotrichum karsti]KAF9879777.1 ubiquitin carboxyl-terminal hydrolase [Colletotrichum karsti]